MEFVTRGRDVVEAVVDADPSAGEGWRRADPFCCE